jgi:exosortase C (VPDSG-CTERM-specific)
MIKLFNNSRQQFGTFVAVSSTLILAFAWPLFQLAEFAVSSTLFSYIILIPVVSLYIVWTKGGPPVPSSRPNRNFSYILSIAGLAVLAAFWAMVLTGAKLKTEDSLALTTLSFVLFFWGICVWFIGGQNLRLAAFPMGLLILLVPFPIFIRTWMEAALQHCSASAALLLFRLTGTPVFYNDLTFQLSDITLEVAPECSGIHSTVALFITSLIAGHFFLRSNWKRAALTLVVLPLAILRNGFRVFTIGELCVHIGPEMIDSKIHHKGGPIFFILSLVPFLIFLIFLVKSEPPASVLNSVSNEA